MFNNIDFQFASQKHTSATFIENSNASVDFFCRIIINKDIMLKKKSYLFWAKSHHHFLIQIAMVDSETEDLVKNSQSENEALQRQLECKNN